MKMHKMDESFYGMTTIGEKGQAVIPAEARKKMRLEKGEKLLVMGIDDDSLVLFKMAGMEEFASDLKKKLASLDKIIKKSKNK